VGHEIWPAKHSIPEDVAATRSIYIPNMLSQLSSYTVISVTVEIPVPMELLKVSRMEQGPLHFQKTVREVVTDHFAKEEAVGHEIWPAKHLYTEHALSTLQLYSDLRYRGDTGTHGALESVDLARRLCVRSSRITSPKRKLWVMKSGLRSIVSLRTSQCQSIYRTCSLNSPAIQ
jgi:hypothetical protein